MMFFLLEGVGLIWKYKLRKETETIVIQFCSHNNTSFGNTNSERRRKRSFILFSMCLGTIWKYKLRKETETPFRILIAFVPYIWKYKLRKETETCRFSFSAIRRYYLEIQTPKGDGNFFCIFVHFAY